MLEQIYSRFNRREFVHPDPLEFLYNYSSIKDREIVAFISSGLAYGRVAMILKSVDKVLGLLTQYPSSYIENCNFSYLYKELSNFKHRFTTGSEIVLFLSALSSFQKEHKLIGNFFVLKMKKYSYFETLNEFVKEILKRMNLEKTHLLPLPEKGSACKRLHLCMRWMVREDSVDPGGWGEISKNKLIVPVDVHMHRIGIKLNFTKRKQADAKTAMEITAGFQRILPEDPVKYDFALTRFGIQKLTDSDLFKKL